MFLVCTQDTLSQNGTCSVRLTFIFNDNYVLWEAFVQLVSLPKHDDLLYRIIYKT